MPRHLGLYHEDSSKSDLCIPKLSSRSYSLSNEALWKRNSSVEYEDLNWVTFVLLNDTMHIQPIDLHSAQVCVTSAHIVKQCSPQAISLSSQALDDI
jgi:hypothetical protein